MRHPLTAPAWAGIVLVTGVIGFMLAGTADGNPQRSAKLIRISAQRYVFIPNQLTLKLGEPVDIEISTLDVPMGFNAPDFAVRGSIVPGQTSHVRFTPTRTGTFTFLCDVFCGSGHEEMSGTITVTE